MRINEVVKRELISWLTPSKNTISTFTQYRERFGRDLIAYVSKSDSGRWKLKLEGKSRQLLCNELSTFEMDEAQNEAEEIIDRYLQDFMIHGNL